MAALNKVLLIGNLGQNVEVKQTPGNKAFATLSIATKEIYMQNDRKIEQTEWHRVIVWNKLAENCAKFLTKGSPVFVEGKLQTRKWQSKTGEDHFSTEIIALNVQFLPNPNQEKVRSTEAPQPTYIPDEPRFGDGFDPSDVPF